MMYFKTSQLARNFAAKGGNKKIPRLWQRCCKALGCEGALK